MTIKIDRCKMNPLIAPADVVPSRPDFKVDGVFNCGVAEYKGETILLCRVAESVICENEDEIKIPVVTVKDGKDVIDVVTYRKSEHPELDFSDSRRVADRSGTVLNLTSLSHLRIARSADGVSFSIAKKPFIALTAKDDSWGMEDPRITKIGDTYYITCTSVTKRGAATSLIKTADFESYERCGIIFAPENKDVTIFPEKICGKYVALNRPVPRSFGNPEMWMARSLDLIHWGEQEHFCGLSCDEHAWENGRIGGGAVPFKTERGFLKIYHAADKNDRYCLGALLLDANDPAKIIAKTKQPILEPEADYEKNGFFGNVVFTCGCIVKDGVVRIYYGAADDKICRADVALDLIFGAMEPVN